MAIKNDVTRNACETSCSTEFLSVRTCCIGWAIFGTSCVVNVIDRAGCPILCGERAFGFLRSEQRVGLRRTDPHTLVPDLHSPGLAQSVMRITAPLPQFWRRHQTWLHRIPMNIAQLLHVFRFFQQIVIFPEKSPSSSWLFMLAPRRARSEVPQRWQPRLKEGRVGPPFFVVCCFTEP